MAAFDTFRPVGAAPSIGGTIARTLTHVAAAATGWYAERSTRNALSNLSDHELEDIGLCRGDIDLIARRPGL